MIETLVTLPIIFFGHGSPMNAIETNAYSQKWKALAKELPTPKAILVVSAHWETDGVRVTGNAKQKTIYDFGGFPKALYDAVYQPPGSIELCEKIKKLIPETTIDNSWGLDHGSWSILLQMYPEAKIPVVQLSLNRRFSAHQHYELSRRLSPLRKEGVLIIASGNVVHNLREIIWDANAKPLKWADEFHHAVRNAIDVGDHQKLINFNELPGAKKSVPTDEHYLPLLYIAGLQQEGERPYFFHEKLEMGSLSMLSVLIK